MDGKLPNLALMQIGAYHKSIGDEVEWWLGSLFKYEKVYGSKIFDFTHDDFPDYVIRGGTGFSWKSTLPSEIKGFDHSGAWFLYPNYKNHIGFTERGCRLNCSFCVVPQKDGKPKEVASIENLLTNPIGEHRLVLLDDDFLGHPRCEKVFEEIIDRDLMVNFSQGLNIRIITKKQAELLAKTKFKNLAFTKPQITFAWDRTKDEKSIFNGYERCLDAGIKPYQMQFFVLIGYDSSFEQDLYRVETIKKWGCDPFVMCFDPKSKKQRRFQKWVNSRVAFKTVNFEDYEPTRRKFCLSD